MGFGDEDNYRSNNFDCTKPGARMACEGSHRTLPMQIEPKSMTGMALSVLSPEGTVCYPKSPLG
jgi:hypothetical protein